MAGFAKLRGLFGRVGAHSCGGRVAALAATHTDLRTKSRDLVRRNAWAQAGIEALVANVVGTGIKPQCLSPDERSKASVQALWRDCAKRPMQWGLRTSMDCRR